jgi:hypothetical protein
MIFALYLLLASIMSVEACSSLARYSGYHIQNPYAGLSFQGSLSLLSRLLVFVYTPLFGFLADTEQLPRNNDLTNLAGFLLTPIALMCVKAKSDLIVFWISRVIQNSATNGTWFKAASSNKTDSVKSKKTISVSLPIRIRDKKHRRLKTNRVLLLLLYIPYYLAWPATLMLIAAFPKYRATLIGVSTIFTSLNTIGMTLWLDPLLVRMQEYKITAQSFLFSTIQVRINASIAAFCLLFLAFACVR